MMIRHSTLSCYKIVGPLEFYAAFFCKIVLSMAHPLATKFVPFENGKGTADALK